MMIIQWEYMVRTIGNEVPSSTFICEKLSGYGNVGWELVSVNKIIIKGEEKNIAIFKRPCGKLHPVIEFELRNPGVDSP